MKAGRVVTFILIAALLGLLASEALYHWPAGKSAIAQLISRGADETGTLRNLQKASSGEAVAEADIARQLGLLRDQFGNDDAFDRARDSSGFSANSLRAAVTTHLRSSAWIEKQIAPRLSVGSGEARSLFEAHPEQFMLPQRYRASHIFLAAPEGIAPEIVAAKQSEIQGLAVRLLGGEKFAQLAAEASEDEATKAVGGDLGYFSAERIPPELFAEVEKLRVGQTSAPIRSHLGFHLLQLTDAKAPRRLHLEEAQAEATAELQNAQRAAAVAQLANALAHGVVN